jgi:hypothetical protein
VALTSLGGRSKLPTGTRMQFSRILAVGGNT